LAPGAGAQIGLGVLLTVTLGIRRTVHASSSRHFAPGHAEQRVCLDTPFVAHDHNPLSIRSRGDLVPDPAKANVRAWDAGCGKRGEIDDRNAS